jgi:hypothetical protein
MIEDTVDQVDDPPAIVSDRIVDLATSGKMTDPRGPDQATSANPHDDELANENTPECIHDLKSEKMNTMMFQTAINDFMGFDEPGDMTALAPIEPVDVTANTSQIARPSSVMPADIRQLTIRNLDTGEEFIIGENDPDFDFDTFELCAGPHHEKNRVTPITGNDQAGDNNALIVQPPSTTTESETNPQNQRPRASLWQLIMTYIFSIASSPRKNSRAAFDGAERQDDDQIHIKDRSNSVSTDDSNTARRPKTPFTKLSSFKFRKELGRGAFGRVLLAEAKTDGKLYALKIISKKNMKSSDKRQAKTERDILVSFVRLLQTMSMTYSVQLAMGHISPHPFTAGLRFAFQSENNLYLGMDYLPGGNLKELIKRFGSLPEVDHWYQDNFPSLITSHII